MEWVRKRDQGASIALDGADWDDVWHIYQFTPTPGDPAWTAMLADRPDLAPGRIHPSVPAAYVTKFSPKPINSRSTAWEITVSYRIGDPKEQDLPPHQRAAVIEVHPESVEVPTLVKQDGKPWINTAGDLLEGITRVENHWVFAVEKNVLAVPAWALNYADAVSSDAVNVRGLTMAKHCLLLKDLRIGNLSKEVIGSTAYLYYPISFSLVFNKRTWKTKALNRGLNQILMGEYIPCLDSNGDPVTEPAFLDESGQQLLYPIDPAQVVIVEGWNHELLPFSALPLS